MIHFSCDMCGRRIGFDEKRYRVLIEVEECDSCEEDLPDDLDDELDVDDIDEKEYQQFRFDLCEDCVVVYAASPLPPLSFQRFRISDN